MTKPLEQNNWCKFNGPSIDRIVSLFDSQRYSEKLRQIKIFYSIILFLQFYKLTQIIFDILEKLDFFILKKCKTIWFGSDYTSTPYGSAFWNIYLWKYWAQTGIYQISSVLRIFCCWKFMHWNQHFFFNFIFERWNFFITL